MPINCTRCEASGFLNLHQVDDATLEKYEYSGDTEIILKWIAENANHDVSVCDCCGDREGWYGVPGEHYNGDDPAGHHGPYAYNGGLCECN